MQGNIKLNNKISNNPIKNEQSTWIDNLPKKVYKWPTDTWKSAQHHQSKSKPEWNIMSYLLGCLLSKRQKTTNDGEIVEKRECKLVQPLWTIVWSCLKKLKV